jgi:hypothetical protein
MRNVCIRRPTALWRGEDVDERTVDAWDATRREARRPAALERNVVYGRRY